MSVSEKKVPTFKPALENVTYYFKYRLANVFYMGYCHLLKQKRPEEVDIKSIND